MNKNYGFSVLELLIGLGIIVAVLVVVANFQVNVFSESNFIGGALIAEQEARNSLKRTISELRSAATPTTGVYPITLATENSLTFYSDIDGDNLKEQLRYFVSTTTLRKGVIKPTGSPLAYVSANEQITDQITNLTNAAQVFSYFDANSNQLPFPVNLPDVRLIKLTYTIDADPNRPPAAITLSSQVSVRSLKY